MYGRSYWYAKFSTAVFMIRGNFLLCYFKIYHLNSSSCNYSKKMTLMGFIYCCWFVLLNTHKLYFWTPISRGFLIDLSIYMFYCSCRYTSIGSIHDTVPNALLSTRNSDSDEVKFKPAYLLTDGRLERAGRAKKNSSAVCGKSSSIRNGLRMENLNSGSVLTASIISVGDEIL